MRLVVTVINSISTSMFVVWLICFIGSLYYLFFIHYQYFIKLILWLYRSLSHSPSHLSWSSPFSILPSPFSLLNCIHSQYPPFYLASLIPSLPLIPFLAFTLTLLLLRLTHYVILTFTHTLPLNRMLLLLTEPIQHSIQYKYPSQFLFSR